MNALGNNYSFAQLFIHITNNYKNRGAIFWKENNEYKNITGKDLKKLVYLTSKSLQKLNLKSHDKAAIISESRFEWAITDFACIVNQLVTVPIYTTMSSGQIKYILEHSEAKLCFVSTELIAEKVSKVFNELEELKYIITYNKLENPQKHILYFQDILSKENYSEEEADKFFKESSEKINENDLLTIIYTSGTTGIPKGVCLSHKNILSNVKSCQKAFSVDSSDRFLSFLPLAHSYERTAGYYFPLSAGAELYFAQSIETLSSQLEETKPAIVTSVPMLFTRIHTRLMKSIKNMPAVQKLITKTALSVGKKYRTRKNNILWKLADKLVFRKIKERTGSQIRFFVSGGSALNKVAAEFFDSIGILILEGYGMTEASPVISVNREDRNKFGTVGIPLECTEVKIAEDGEILARGDNVMTWYYKNEKDTKDTIIDGWLHTGDIGEFDKDGFLKITDRKKSLIKTAVGKYISLTHIEETIGNSKYIEQIITFASDERQFVTALIVPNTDELITYAESSNIQFTNNTELIEHSEVYKLIESEIKTLQKNHAKYERVRRFVLLTTQFTIESGELTPTLKLKRKVIEEKYKNTLDKLYSMNQ